MPREILVAAGEGGSADTYPPGKKRKYWRDALLMERKERLRSIRGEKEGGGGIRGKKGELLPEKRGQRQRMIKENA